MKKAKKGKLGQNALKSGAAPGVEPQAKPSPSVLSCGGPGVTPGPWQVEDGGFVGGPVGYGRICQMWNKYEEDFQNAEGNAHLIAAAPDMYAVLDHIVQGVIDVHVVQMAREALAKARGERSAE